jgi:hypothetical protein
LTWFDAEILPTTAESAHTASPSYKRICCIGLGLTSEEQAAFIEAQGW